MFRRWMLLILIVVVGLGYLPTQPVVAQSGRFDSLNKCDFKTPIPDLEVGAVVYSWGNGSGCAENLDTTFPMASVGKIFIAALLYDEVYAGHLSFDQALVFSPDYYMGGGSACLTRNDIGSSFDLGYLGNIMIMCSDNSATWMLMDLLGWQNVNTYIDNLGIDGIGIVIPYSEVDRLKLTILDNRWANVPRHLASQFIRERRTAELTPTYFGNAPSYSQNEMKAANAEYLARYSYNTATPRAIATYIARLRENVLSNDLSRSTTAQWMFNTLLLTQRGYSTQYLPGRAYVGTKNGFDTGYRAEVSITFDDFNDYVPEAMTVIVVKHRNINSASVSTRLSQGPTIDFLRSAGETIAQILYPNDDRRQIPLVQADPHISRVVANTRDKLFGCWETFTQTENAAQLYQCWQGISFVATIDSGDWMGVGVILHNLDQQDARITVIYTDPNNIPRAYQLHRFWADATAVSWFERVEERGTWRLDVYFNLRPIFSQIFVVR